MFKIGITGSIGTGKSTIAKMFSKFGISIFDADKEIKKILIKKNIKKKIGNTWPGVLKTNNIDKIKLRSIIFSNKNERKKLEKLLYPYLKIELNKFEKNNYNKILLVYDIPLIYETKTEKNYDLILLTNCSRDLQRERVLARNGMSNSLFESINNTQLSFEEKKKFKPTIVNTSSYKIFIFIKIIVLIIKILISLKIKDGTRKKVNT